MGSLPYRQDQIDNIEAVQRRAARFIKNDYDWNSSVSQMLHSLSLEPFKERRKIHRLRTFYQAHNNIIALPVPQHYYQQSLPLTRSQTSVIKAPSVITFGPTRNKGPICNNVSGWAMGRVQGMRSPPPPTPEMTCGFLIQLMFCQKKLCGLLAVELKHETRNSRKRLIVAFP